MSRSITLLSPPGFSFCYAEISFMEVMVRRLQKTKSTCGSNRRSWSFTQAMRRSGSMVSTDQSFFCFLIYSGYASSPIEEQNKTVPLRVGRYLLRTNSWRNENLINNHLFLSFCHLIPFSYSFLFFCFFSFDHNRGDQFHFHVPIIVQQINVCYLANLILPESELNMDPFEKHPHDRNI